MVTESEQPPPLHSITVQVLSAGHIAEAQGSARRIAERIGFSNSDCDEIALVVSELASNLLRHAGGGRLTFEPASERTMHVATGLQIESADNGPGIPDFELAVTDGFSTAGSLGTGLGAVNRLMDELECSSLPPQGARIVCRRWLRPRGCTGGRELEFGVATRPYRYLRHNGDAFVIRQWHNKALAGVIDGLGHGQFAQRAAQVARQYIERHYDQPLETLFRGVQRACQATRGVVMALTLIDSGAHKFALAGIGNIEVRVSGSPTPVSFVTRRGVVGLQAPQPLIVEHPWSSGMVLVLHSDGLRTHWDWSDFPGLRDEPAAAIAQSLLASLGKAEDDATVLVARNVSQ